MEDDDIEDCMLVRCIKKRWENQPLTKHRGLVTQGVIEVAANDIRVVFRELMTPTKGMLQAAKDNPGDEWRAMLQAAIDKK